MSWVERRSLRGFLDSNLDQRWFEGVRVQTVPSQDAKKVEELQKIINEDRKKKKYFGDRRQVRPFLRNRPEGSEEWKVR